MSVAVDATQRDGSILLTTTTDANQVITTSATVDDQAYAVVAKIYGIATAASDEAFFYQMDALFLNAGGTLSQVDTTNTSIAHDTVTATPSLNGNNTTKNIEVRITPQSTKAITWRADLEVQAIQQYVANGGYTK